MNMARSLVLLISLKSAVICSSLRCLGSGRGRRNLLPCRNRNAPTRCLACPSMAFISSRARVRSLIASCPLSGTQTGVNSPARYKRVSVIASRRSVFTRSPDFLGISDEALPRDTSDQGPSIDDMRHNRTDLPHSRMILSPHERPLSLPASLSHLHYWVSHHNKSARFALPVLLLPLSSPCAHPSLRIWWYAYA